MYKILDDSPIATSAQSLALKKKPGAPLTLSNAPSATWTRMLSTGSAVHRWAQELRTLLDKRSSSNETDWHLLGHAVLLEGDVLDEVPDLLEEVALIAGMPLHVFSAANVVHQFLPWFSELPDEAPSLVYLAPGEWMNPSSPGTEGEPPACAEGSCTDAFLDALQNLIQGLSTRPVVVVTAGRSFEQLCVCLRQVGSFDRRIRVPEWNADSRAGEFLRELGPELADESMSAKQQRLGALLEAEYPDRRRRQLTVLALKRLARHQQRRVGFTDLVQIVTQGTTEEDPLHTEGAFRYRTAVHEAGHALILHLDSSAMSAPAFCTAMRSRDAHGRTVASFEAIEFRGGDLTVESRSKLSQ